MHVSQLHCSRMRVCGDNPQVGYDSRRAAVALRGVSNTLCLIVQCQS